MLLWLLRNANFDIITGFLALPLWVANGSKALEMCISRSQCWHGAPHIFIVSSLLIHFNMENSMFFCVHEAPGDFQSTAKEPLIKVTPLIWGWQLVLASLTQWLGSVLCTVQGKTQKLIFFLKLIRFSSASVNFYLIIIINFLHVTAAYDGIHCLTRLYATFHYKLWDAFRVRVQRSSTNICTAL